MLAYPVGLSPYPFLSLKHGLILIPRLSLLSFRDLSNRFTQPQIPRSSPFSFLSLPFPTNSHRHPTQPTHPLPQPSSVFFPFFSFSREQILKPESQKGLYIGIFWSIFNLGGVVGAAVSFGENSKSKVRSPPSADSFMKNELI